MARDLLLKHNSHNWSRDLDDVAPIPPSPRLNTAVEKKVRAQTAKLAATKTAAAGGDKKAQKKWAKICKKVEKIRRAAAAGNPDAIRQLAKINATDLFAPAMVSGNDKLTEILTSGSFVGRQEILGRDEILGKDEILGAFVGKDEILGLGQFIGEEELALAREGGASERGALARRLNVGHFSGGRHIGPPRSDPYKVKHLHPDYVKVARKSAQDGNKDAQHILEAHGLSW